ncbi:zinc transporter 7-like isoform X2 [Halichondria panicea]|uniref:zinc transporter 7-like isoform X2 n=1 Tax=Halichondria panicea TaxID=6063 RepID=UPI00312BA388
MSTHSHSHGSTATLLPQHTQDVSVSFDNYSGSEVKPSISLSGTVKKWARAILSEPATRNLFFFLLINLSFAFVELLYGMWTNSLGLISDSFHMFFDCTALLAGLVATVVANWAPNERFSFGYVRAEVIAGFVNALFLLFIGFFIFAEAIERAFEPPEVSHDRLMVISVGGFIVNLVGIFVFQHGGGGGHGHSHGDGHGHSHGSGRTQIMQGIFLHILADTLGSVGVIISSLLIQSFGWMMADPICSMFIAALIIVSVYPLLTESTGVLMQRTPSSLEHVLQEAVRKVYEQEGVVQVHSPHFWTLCSGEYMGSLRLEIVSNTDSAKLVANSRGIFKGAGLTDVVIETTAID